MTTATIQAAVFNISSGEPVFSHSLTTSVFSSDGRVNFRYTNSFNEFDFRVSQWDSGDFFLLNADIVERTVFDLSFGSTSSATYVTLTDTANNLEYLFQTSDVGSNVPNFPTSQSGWQRILDRATWIAKTDGTGGNFSISLNTWLNASVTENDVVDLSTSTVSEDISLGIGDDILYSGAGDDMADGGAGNDRLVAKSNDDGEFDAAWFSGGAGNDVLKIKGNSVATFFGDEGDDRLIGGEAADSLYGGSDNDVILGLGGDDFLEGDTGDDLLYGGRGNDQFSAGDGNDVLRGNRGNDFMQAGLGDDDLRGGGQQDDLQGEDGNDFLFGENGLDRLDGGNGNDVLTGGYGGGQMDNLRDTFVFAPGGGYDRIKDFEDGIDQIDLTAFGFTDFAAEVLGLAADTSAGLRVRFESGNVLFIENFTKAEFDASDVVL